jgi:hypothetical protein
VSRENIKKVRKCADNKWDHTFEEDGAAFPMQVFQGGTLYGFCPGKAQWYSYLEKTYALLSLCCELNVLPYPGSIMDQPKWVIEHLSWFSRRYNQLKQVSRSGFGKLEKKKTFSPAKNIGSDDGSRPRRPNIHNRSRQQRGR